MRTLRPIDEIREGALGDPARDAIATAGRALDVGLPDRCVRYVFSDASVGRDMHTIQPDAWQTDNFARNPVFLWAHQADDPPIGRVEDLATQAGGLVGMVRYAERDAYPFADTIYELTKRGFINASSTGWIPLEWTAANDRSRPGGLDFRKVELLEISAVPVPALPSALVTARAAGVDTRPLFDWAERVLDCGGLATIGRAELEDLRKAARMPSRRSTRAAANWKCGADRGLSINHDRQWDGGEAAGRMLDAATEAGKINVAKAKRGFLLYDASNAEERGSYKEPFADILDGKLTAIASGIRAAASRLPQVEGASDEAKAAARAVIDHYEGQMTKEGGHASSDGERRFARLAQAALRRDLMNVAELCWHMDNLESCYQRCMREAEIEGDGSPIPGRMRDWLNDGHRILADMAGEETQEQIDGTQGGQGGDDAYRLIEAAIARALHTVGIVRVGKTISAATRGRIRKAHDHAKAAVDTLSGMLDDADNADPEGDLDDDMNGDDLDSRALRARKAKARAIAARLKINEQT